MPPRLLLLLNCPQNPLSCSVDYILWIQDLLSATYSETFTAASSKSAPQSQLLGVDIGTGASAIYPLLATSVIPNLQALATGSLLNAFYSSHAALAHALPMVSDPEEVDVDSFRQAVQNVQANPSAASRVQLQQAFPDQPIFACLHAHHGTSYALPSRCRLASAST